MRKKMVASLFMVLILMVSMFAGCSKGNGDSAKNGKTGKAVKIGVINFDYSTLAGSTLKKYLEYLEKDSDLNVKFVFSTSQANDQEHLAAVDALITQGVDGILSSLDSGQEAVVKACNDAEVYYANYNTASISDTFSKVKDSKYFVGQVADGKVDASELGEIAAQVVIENGFKNVGITSFPQKMILGQGKADQAFRKKMKELDPNGAVKIYDTHEHFFDGSGIDTYINTNSEMDALFGLGAGLQFDYPKIVSANKKGKVKLLAIGMQTDSATTQEFKNGDIVMGTISNVEAIAAPLVIMLDALNGNKYSDYNGALQLDGTTMVIKNSEDVDNLTKYTYYGEGQPLVTTDDLKDLMVTFNEKATLSNLKSELLKMDLKDAVEKNKK